MSSYRYIKYYAISEYIFQLIKDSTTFYGVEEENLDKLDEISNFIAQKFAEGRLEDYKGSVPNNVLVLAPFEVDKQVSYHRALVVAQKFQGPDCTVKFVDFGNYEQVPENAIKARAWKI